MTKRVKMVVAYDGTNYCGWQKQPNGVCIEEVLNRELSKLLNEPIAPASEVLNKYSWAREAEKLLKLLRE